MFTRSPCKIVYLSCFLAMLAGPARASSWLDYFAWEPPFKDPAITKDFRVVTALVENEDLPGATAALDDFISRHDRLAKDAPVAWAQSLTNLALLEAAREDYESALAALERGIFVLESSRSPFSVQLIDPLLVRSLIHKGLQRWDDAEDDLLRAQHVIHRQRGVYSPEQLPVVKDMADLKHARGEVIDADRQQIFRLKISERNWGRQSERIIPLLHELGAYFAARGSSIPAVWNEDPDALAYRDELFRESIDLYHRALDIVEQRYGENDLRLLDSLRGLADARILQGKRCYIQIPCSDVGQARAEDVMERAVQIVRSNPGTDLPDYVRTLVELGDVYTITHDSRADEVYLEAWNLIADKPEYDDLRRELFGRPTRLMPMSSKVFVLDRYPSGLDESDELYVNAQYTIESNGRVTDVEILDGNVPNEEKRLFRNTLTRRAYRPRIVDGELVDTEGMILHQAFRVREKEPQTEISFQAGPEFRGPRPRLLRQ